MADPQGDTQPLRCANAGLCGVPRWCSGLEVHFDDSFTALNLGCGEIDWTDCGTGLLSGHHVPIQPMKDALNHFGFDRLGEMQVEAGFTRA